MAIPGFFTPVRREGKLLVDGMLVDNVPVDVVRDHHGYTWIVAHRPPDDVAALVTDLHAVNQALEDNGFGPQPSAVINSRHDAASCLTP